MWSDFENETLIHNHKISKLYKKKYQRASQFQKSIYNTLGLLNVIVSVISTTYTWTSDLNSEEKKFIIGILITFTTILSTIQNYYNFQELSNKYMILSKSYLKIQNKIEIIGNIHPDYRTSKPYHFLKIIQNKLNELLDNRIETSTIMDKWFYQKKIDNISYLELKHQKYKELKENEKLNYTKDITIDILSDGDENDIEHIS